MKDKKIEQMLPIIQGLLSSGHYTDRPIFKNEFREEEILGPELIQNREGEYLVLKDAESLWETLQFYTDEK